MLERLQHFEDAGNESFFLWGARQTGKSTLLKSLFPHSLLFDLLLSEEFERLKSNPKVFCEIILADTEKRIVIIDEIQRIPELLNEVHWLIVNQGTRFILSGSSPRRILRSETNLLGGRALRYELFPLVSAEIPDFDLIKALNSGLLPKHYLSTNYKRLLAAYIGNYLKDELVREAQLRSLSIFTRFLEAAAFSNGEMVNYSNIATDTGVSSNTIKSYFQILEQTLLGRFVPVFQKRPKRRVIQAPKFYFFDVGIVNHLLKRGTIEYKSESFGLAFEHFIYQELYAHSHYSGKDYLISYWRTASQLEVDFVLGIHEVIIEVKASDRISSRHYGGLKAFMEEYKVKKAIIVCTEIRPRKVGDIWVLPWKNFLEQLWSNQLI
ncbi:MAG: AAA family ATPase [Chitinophagales bacterium]|nr:AAA family ATPase [Chitinophagales bacterium]